VATQIRAREITISVIYEQMLRHAELAGAVFALCPPRPDHLHKKQASQWPIDCIVPPPLPMRHVELFNAITLADYY